MVDYTSPYLVMIYKSVDIAFEGNRVGPITHVIPGIELLLNCLLYLTDFGTDRMLNSSCLHFLHLTVAYLLVDYLNDVVRNFIVFKDSDEVS